MPRPSHMELSKQVNAAVDFFSTRARRSSARIILYDQRQIDLTRPLNIIVTVTPAFHSPTFPFCPKCQHQCPSRTLHTSSASRPHTTPTRTEDGKKPAAPSSP